MRFGSREIANVVLRAKATQKLGNRTFYKDEPVLYFDTLKTSSLEGAATTVYAQGGRGNSRLIAWEGERTLTWNMQDALLSPESFSVLTGAGLISATEEKPMYVHTTSQVEVKTANTIVLDELACWTGDITSAKSASYKNANAQIFCMKLNERGEVVSEPCIPASVEHKNGTTIIKCHADGENTTVDLAVGTIALVDYYTLQTGTNATTIEITPDKFGGNYYLEASTLFRRTDGVDMPAEFIIPNGKIQSNFTFSMASSGDPSVFDFVMDAFPDYTKFDKTKKVLAAIQIIDEDAAEDAGSRTACEVTGE